MDNIDIDVNEYMDFIKNSTEINDIVKEFFFSLINQYNKKHAEREQLETQINELQSSTMQQLKNNNYDIILSQNYIKTLKELRMYIKDIRYQEKDILNTIKDLQQAIINSPQISANILTSKNDIILKQQKLKLDEQKLNDNTISLNVSGNESIESLLEISNKIIDEIFSQKGDKNARNKSN